MFLIACKIKVQITSNNIKITYWISVPYVLFVNLTKSCPICGRDVSCSLAPSVCCTDLVCSLTDVVRKNNSCLLLSDIFFKSRFVTCHLFAYDQRDFGKKLGCSIKCCKNAKTRAEYSLIWDCANVTVFLYLS